MNVLFNSIMVTCINLVQVKGEVYVGPHVVVLFYMVFKALQKFIISTQATQQLASY